MNERVVTTRAAQPVLYALLAAMLVAGLVGTAVVRGGAGTDRAAPSGGGVDEAQPAPDGAAPGAPGLGTPGTVPGGQPGAGGQAAAGGRGPSGSGKGSAGPGAPPTTVGSKAGAPGGSIKVGIILPAGSPGTAVGVPFSYDPSDLQKIVRAVLDETNATGGLGGRQVEPVWASNDNTDTQAETQTREQNRICTLLTEDKKVFMVFNFSSLGANFAYDCYASHKTPLLDTPFALESDQQRLDEMDPWLVLPVSLNFTRMAKLLPLALRDQGFLTQKIGVVGLDLPPVKRSAQKVLVPALEAAGGKVVEQVYFTPSYSAAGAAIANAVLAFKDKVDRVVFWSPGGGAALLFPRQADSQGYHPRYAITTYDAPALTQDYVPASQFKGAVGVGFAPQTDLADKVATPLLDTEKACFAVVNKRAGTALATRRQNTAAGLALGACEFFSLMKEALAPVVGKPLATNEVASYVYALGTGHSPVMAVRSRFGKGRPDGIVAYSHLAFDDACACFAYQGPWRDSPF